MGASKNYFRDQFQINKLTLEYEEAADFYLGSWQSGQSPLPLLFVRLIIFAGCVGILAASLALTGTFMSLNYWPIYMTHWGVVIITVVSGLALLVSVMAAVKGPIDSSKGLPWYVKLYWVWYCTTLPVAFFITVFYYALLAGLDVDFSVDPVLDLFIHGMNSVMMLCLLLSSRLPVYLLQYLYPLLFSIIYLIFSIIWYYAGGVNPWGDSWIYPMLDWSNPGLTVGLVFACAFFLLILHIIVVALSSLRDFLFRRYVHKFQSVDITY